MNQVLDNVLGAIGCTPLVRLNRLGQGLASPIYMKLESMNPGGSVKDRIARAMIEAAEKDGRLQPGGTLVEATAGNTGIGLAMVAAIKGYHCICVMPDKMSREKRDLLKALGAEVVVTPTAVAPDSPESYHGVAERLAREIPHAFRPNQFENPANPLAHYLTTGPEIWSASQGKIDVLVAGIGTGGTISGTAKFLKEKKPSLTVIGADPEGSILSGDKPRPYQVEGIGEDFIPKNFDRSLVDEIIRVSDRESFHTGRRLAREEGILAGGSSGTALAAALRYAQRLEELKYIVVILPDTGRNYLNKMFSDAWLRENSLEEIPSEPNGSIKDLLQGKLRLPPLIAVSPNEILMQAIDLMQLHHISQVPVLENNTVTGSLNETAVMTLLRNGVNAQTVRICEVMSPALPILDEENAIAEAYRILLAGASGILIQRRGVPEAVITRSDLVNFWISRQGEQNHEV